jgi:hypothetical protein
MYLRPEKVIFDLQQLANERVHFRVGGEIHLNPEIWMQLIEASERSQSVFIRYYSPKRQQESERTIDLKIYSSGLPLFKGDGRGILMPWIFIEAVILMCGVIVI